MIGKQILNYQVKSLIGEGGMGNVYLAEHTSIGRTVAIKALRSELASNEEIRKRFKNEASVMARLQHPSIVSLFDYVEQDGGLYLIMEYVEGQELTDLLRDLKHPLPIARAKNIMTGILKAFAYAHSNGVVHRDVKPANILITKDDKVKVLDFGIAKLVGDSEFNLTKTGTQVGTVYYMSPEQVKAKELDLRSDIYSLGITFYELFTGFCPYKTLTSEYEVYDKIVKQDLIPLTETMGDDYEQVWEVIKKATAKNPDDRYQTCENLLSDLNVKHNATPKKKPREKETIISDSSISSNINSEKIKKKGNSRRSLTVGISVVRLLALIITVYLAFRGGNIVAGDFEPDANDEETLYIKEVLQEEWPSELEAQIDAEINTIQIGEQEWHNKNLTVTNFNNGDPINIVRDPGEWEWFSNSETPACCYYDNNTDNGEVYGVMYNYWAVTDDRGIAPQGFRIPENSDWNQIESIESLNVNNYGGHRTTSGSDVKIDQRHYFWSVTNAYYGKAWACILYPTMTERKEYSQGDGMYVRCIKE